MTTTVDTYKSLENQEPDIMLSVKQVFGIDTDIEVPAFSNVDDHVPDIDEAYRFDRDTTLAILAGFTHNRRVRYRVITGPGNLPILNKLPHV